MKVLFNIRFMMAVTMALLFGGMSFLAVTPAAAALSAAHPPAIAASPMTAAQTAPRMRFGCVVCCNARMFIVMVLSRSARCPGRVQLPNSLPPRRGGKPLNGEGRA